MGGMSECSVLNPYDLLGVSLNSTVQDVKRAYYQLALVAHPDKGGSADQMRTVQSAYEYVSLQICGIRRDTYEDAEEEFKRFCEEQQLAPHPFYDIQARALDLPTFGELWAKRVEDRETVVDRASHPGGYEDRMAASEIGTEYSEVIPDSGAALPPLSQAIQLFEAPVPAVQPAALVRDLTAPADAAVDDFSTATLLDYAAAFGPLLPDGIPAPDSTLTDASLEALIATRAVECPHG